MRPLTSCQAFTRPPLPVTRYTFRKYHVIDKLASKPEAIAIPHESIAQRRIDPHALLASELSNVRGRMLSLLGSAHPGLAEIAEFYFLQPSKQVRSLLVLLFSRATNGLGSQWEQKKWEAECDRISGRKEELDRPLQVPDVLNEWNPSMPDNSSSFESVFQLQRIPSIPESTAQPPLPTGNPEFPPYVVDSSCPLLPTQMRLAQIVEMIHVASLLHDGIQKNNVPENTQMASSSSDSFGNKLSILGGDFLLGRASTALSRLGESEVVELVASVISNIVEGEIVSMDGRGEIARRRLSSTQKSLEGAWDVYLQKIYLKSASLMAKSARAAVILGGCNDGEQWKEIAYAYGRNLGIAYQLAEDASESKDGRLPLHHDIVTGPLLYAWEEYPELQPLINRNFSDQGDVELALDFVNRSSGIERTHRLAQVYAKAAKEALLPLPEGDLKVALGNLADSITKRIF